MFGKHILFLNGDTYGGSMKKILIYIIIVNCMLYIPISAVPLPEYKNYQYIKPCEILGEDGTLILSNSPETVKEKGILYCEQLLGKGRLVFHHVNATHENDQRLLIVVKNLTKSEQRFEVHQEGYSMLWFLTGCTHMEF